MYEDGIWEPGRGDSNEDLVGLCQGGYGKNWPVPLRMLNIGIIGDWESRGKPANPGLPGKRMLKWCVCVCYDFSAVILLTGHWKGHLAGKVPLQISPMFSWRHLWDYWLTQCFSTFPLKRNLLQKFWLLRNLIRWLMYWYCCIKPNWQGDFGRS